MKKKYNATTMNMVLALGVVCILAGILFFARIASSFSAKIELWTIIMSVSGAFLFYLSLVRLRYVIVFFTGLYSCLTGAVFIVITSGLVESGLERFWPISVIIAGFCVIFTGIAKDRSIKISCIIPSSIIIILGIFFLLFSLDVIKGSFKEWISLFWPVFPFLIGTVLVILFLFQKSPWNNLLKDVEFDNDDGDPIKE